MNWAAQIAPLELLRTGYDNVVGFIIDESIQEPLQLSQMSVCDLKAAVKTGNTIQILDVRNPGEWEKNHIEGATHIPLPQLQNRLGEIQKGKPTAVICGSGYRSSIAASLLLKKGFPQLQNVMGGMGAYMETKCPNWQAADLVY